MLHLRTDFFLFFITYFLSMTNEASGILEKLQSAIQKIKGKNEALPENVQGKQKSF